MAEMKSKNKLEKEGSPEKAGTQTHTHTHTLIWVQIKKLRVVRSVEENRRRCLYNKFLCLTIICGHRMLRLFKDPQCCFNNDDDDSSPGLTRRTKHYLYSTAASFSGILPLFRIVTMVAGGG